MKVLIIGGGSIGRAIRASMVSGAAVGVFDNDPAKTTVSTIDAGIEGAHLIFICAPSGSVKSIVASIANSGTEAPVVLLSKGLDGETGAFPYELLQSAGIKKWAILYGPMIAHGLLEKKHSFGMLASPDKTVFSEVQKIFADHVHIEYTPDVQTVSVLGIAKNIYALGAGILDGLKAGENARGMYAVRVLQEMKSIVNELKGDATQAEYISGLGDFIATSTSEYSKNRSAGNSLVNGNQTSATSEGLVSVQLFCEKLSFCPPLISALKSIAKKEKSPEVLLKTLVLYE